MDVASVKHDIKMKSPKHFYVFSGPEIRVMDVYINKLAECINTKVIRVDSVAELMPRLRSKSFVSNTNVYVIHNDMSVVKEDKVIEALQLGKLQKESTVILIYDSLDKRLKFYKSIKDSLVEFESLNEAILKRYIAKEITLSDVNSSKLIEVCENSYNRILLEIDKIKHLKNAVSCDIIDYTHDKAFKDLLFDGVIYQPPKDAIFDFVDAVCRRQSKKSFNLLQQSYSVGESSMVLLSVLYTNFKQIFQVQSYRGDNIAKATGLTPFQVKLAKEKAGKYSLQELENILKLIRRIEKSIKTGEIDESVSVEYLLVNIL